MLKNYTSKNVKPEIPSNMEPSSKVLFAILNYSKSIATKMVKGQVTLINLN